MLFLADSSHLLEKYKDLTVSFAELTSQFAEEDLTLNVAGALKLRSCLRVQFLIRANRHLARTTAPKVLPDS